MKKVSIVLVVIITLSTMVFAPTSFAYNKIKLFKAQDSMKDTVINNGSALMLKQDWYGMKFEVNPEKQSGSQKLSAVDIDEYRKALKEVSFGMKEKDVRQSVYGEVYSPVTVNIYFIDYKLKNYSNAMALSFKDNSIVVFGSYYRLSKQTIDRMAVHELGHQVDFQLMSSEKWNEYRKLRGIEDTTKYNDSSKVYSERPQEIFAEDFRILFGGKDAQAISHLNKNLKDPRQVNNLKEFFLSLIVE